MASVAHFSILFLALILGQFSGGVSQLYGLNNNVYNNYKEYDLYNPNQELDESPSLYTRYLSPDFTSLSPYAYIKSTTYENDMETNDLNENSYESSVVAAYDSKGETYLLTENTIHTLKENGLINDDGTVYVPTGALQVNGEEAVDPNSGSVTYVVPEESFQDAEADNVLPITDEEAESYGRTVNLPHIPYYSRRISSYGNRYGYRVGGGYGRRGYSGYRRRYGGHRRPQGYRRRRTHGYRYGGHKRHHPYYIF